MFTIITGALIISLLHAVIPNHWLPVIAIGRKEQWTLQEVTNVTLLSAVAHGFSTVVLGFILSALGAELAKAIDHFTHLIAPVVLSLLGLFFIYRHHNHKHFRLDDGYIRKQSKRQIVITLVIAMFFSPCMEIEAYFLLAGTQPKWFIGVIGLMYLLITTAGMVLLVRFAYKGLLKLNWHSLEHNAGLITGLTLIVTGIFTYFIH